MDVELILVIGYCYWMDVVENGLIKFLRKWFIGVEREGVGKLVK